MELDNEEQSQKISLYISIHRRHHSNDKSIATDFVVDSVWAPLRRLNP